MRDEFKNPDVLVVGSGIAGVGAALGAAKTGAKVLLITAEGSIGGDAITGMPLLGTYNARGEQIVGGVLNELVDMCNHRNGYIGPVCDWRMVYGLCVDPNALYLAIAETLENYQVKLLLNSTVSAVKCRSGQIDKVSVTGKDGAVFDLGAKFIIDATGDANIVKMAGMPYESGDQQGIFQPVSLVFRVCNVDFEPLLNFVRDNPGEILLAENAAIGLDQRQCAQKAAELGYPYIALSAHGALLGEAIQKDEMFPCTAFFMTPTSIRRREVCVNVTRKAGIDPGNQKELSASYPELCRQIQQALHFLQSKVPGFRQSDISGIAHRIGIRETQRIIGDYILSTDDVRTGKKCRDGIAKGAHHIDVHGSGKDQVRIPVENGQSYDIPFGCLIPQGAGNLLAAGRCLSASREAHGSARVMGPCIATGEAAGTAAALSVDRNLTDIHDLEVEILRRVLKEHGAVLEGTH